MKKSLKHLGFYTAMSVVIANMVGTGVFTSLGYQAVSIQSVFPLLLLWVVGGFIALCGALNYGELAALMPRSGGEYHFLSKIYHPAFGFLSGWISATVGFAAPVALASLALGEYAGQVVHMHPKLIGMIVLIALTAIHSYDLQTGGKFQKYATLIKVLLIVLLILAGFLFTSDPQAISILPKTSDWASVFSSGFAISLAYVSFSYSGWNASAYITNEIENPKKNVPRSLILGTLFVTLIYVFLNFIFLYTIPVQELAEKQAADFSVPLEVGYLSAENIFGHMGGKIMSIMIALLLVSSISAMILAGPRVTQVMGEDIPILAILSRKNKKGIPLYAILLQFMITTVLLLTSSYQTVLYYIAFTLDIFTFSTVLGVIIMRRKLPNAERKYKAWAYPLSTIVFLAGTGWTMFFLLTQRTTGSLIALGTVAIGLIFYFINEKYKNEKK